MGSLFLFGLFHFILYLEIQSAVAQYLHYCVAFHYASRPHFIHPTVDGICVVSSLGLSYLLSLWMVLYASIGAHTHSILLRIYLEVELLSQR